METNSPTRRERRRRQMAADIIAAAREILRAGDMNAISLRTIAGQIGVSPAAIYRYFPGQNALIRSLHDDILDELRTAIISAREESAYDSSASWLQLMARAFRKWALDHPPEFLFALRLDQEEASESVTARKQPAERILTLASMLLAEFTRSLHRSANAAFLSAWVKLYGLVVLESSGTLGVTDMDTIFDETLGEFAAELPAEYRWAYCVSPSTMDIS